MSPYAPMWTHSGGTDFDDIDDLRRELGARLDQEAAWKQEAQQRMNCLAEFERELARTALDDLGEISGALPVGCARHPSRTCCRNPRRIVLGRDCGHPVDNYSLCPIMKDDGAFAPLQGKDYAGSMHRHGYAKPGNETPSLCITYWREHI